ncbi:MAG: CBS domain-containing protein [Acidimicrobiales bacterium]
MEIGSLMSRAVLTVEATESFVEAAVLMVERGVGSAVVVTNGRPTGLITDRDALRAVAREGGYEGLTVADFVSGRLMTAEPETDMLEAARTMREKGFRHLVVVDDDGDLLGVFSMRDLVVGLMGQLRSLSTPASSPAP